MINKIVRLTKIYKQCMSAFPSVKLVISVVEPILGDVYER